MPYGGVFAENVFFIYSYLGDGTFSLGSFVSVTAQAGALATQSSNQEKT